MPVSDPSSPLPEEAHHAAVTGGIRAPSGPGRWWLAGLAATAVALLLALSAGLLWQQREAAVGRAQAQAQREVQRLAAELEQSLRLARAILTQPGARSTQGTDILGDQRPLAEALSLPFDLRLLADGHGMQVPAGEWMPGLARQEAYRWFLPLHWREPADVEGRVYEMRLSRDAVLARFAADGLPPGGSLSLFRLEDDGSTTVLLRYPLIESEQGRNIRGHIAAAVQRAPAGVFQAEAVLDGVDRIVGYRQLNHDARRLLMVYALPMDQVLAAWWKTLPVAVALTLLIAAAMVYGAWRLNRTLGALQRSERHFQTLTAHLPDVVVRYDRDGRVLYVNEAVQAANGLSPQDMMGRTFAEMGAPEHITAAWTSALDRVFTSGQDETLYFEYPGPQGPRYWEAQARLEPVAPGHRPTVLVINRDITERHAAEQRRLVAQRLFETVFLAAPQAMSLSDLETGRFLQVNDAFCELYGRPREELEGRTSLELGLWPRPENRRRLLDAVASGQPVRDLAEHSRRPDGTHIEVRISAERVQVDGGARLLLMFRDVTQQQRAQQALARSELRFRIAAAHGQVWDWDFGQGGVQASDEFFVELGHPSPAQADMPETFFELIHPEDLPHLRQVLHAFLRGESEYRFEFRARDAQGVYRWFDTRGSGIRDANGRVTYMAGTTFEITERKRLEEAQRQTLTHLETVTNASPVLLWTTGADKGADWFNQGWLDFTGRTLREESGQGWLQGVHPDDRDACFETYAAAYDARTAYSSQYRLRHHNGDYRWLHSQGRPRFDADGCFIGFIGSCLDMTDLRHAEEALREQDAVLRQVFDVLKDMLFVLDDEERFVFFQASDADRLYRRPEDFLARRMSEVLPPPLVATLRSAMERAREAGMQEVDYSLEVTGGERRFNARLAWLPGDAQCMFLVRDVTAQFADQQERERLSGFVLLLFRLATRFINLPLQRMDESIQAALGDLGRFVGADRAYLFGYDFEAGTCSNTHEWCAEGIAAERENLQNLPLDLGPGWVESHRRGEMVYLPDVAAMPDGELKGMLSAQGIRSLITLPLMGSESCLGYVGLDSVRSLHRYDDEEITLLQLFAQMLVNVQERSRAQQRLRELNEQLESRVQERTQQLAESVQRLQTVNSELESFNYSASHDLRTPLRGIEGFSSLLLQEHADQLDEQGREYLRRIQRATLHMSRLVSDLLAYSRLQHLADHVEPVDMADCVREVLVPFGDELAARQGQVSVDVAPSLRARADAQGLSIVLRNLLDNAMKFTPAERPPRIHIGAQKLGDRVRLSVSDEGMGFDMRYHDRIFGMFQRLHRQDQIPGTGIGLALVRKAVERMGGSIRAESAPGQGARFEIELPAA